MTTAPGWHELSGLDLCDNEFTLTIMALTIIAERRKELNMDDLISIAEYADNHGRDPITVRAKCQAGGYETARKIGNNWVISASEPYTDRRETSGKYKDWRKKKKVLTKQEQRIKELTEKERRRRVK